MNDTYITLKSQENRMGRVAMHATTNVAIPFIVTSILVGKIPRDVKCISYKHAELVYDWCQRWLFRVPLKNGMLLELGRA